jgi:hypothetical protein
MYKDYQWPAAIPMHGKSVRKREMRTYASYFDAKTKNAPLPGRSEITKAQIDEAT